MSDIETLRRILASHRVIAVVGLSAQWHRPSYFAAKYMKEHGYRVVPINPSYPRILDETSYPSLEALPPDLAASIGIVDCFRRTEDIMPIARQAVAIGAKVLWQQIVVLNHAVARRPVREGRVAFSVKRRLLGDEMTQSLNMRRRIGSSRRKLLG